MKGEFTADSGRNKFEVVDFVLTTQEAITSINSEEGVHEDIHSFWYTGTLAYFPQSLEKFFPNLEEIYIWNSSLREIKQENLKPFTSLKILHLKDNQIEELDSNLFEFNTGLHNIHLGNNKIRLVGKGIFGPLQYLPFVHLENNTCINEEAISRVQLHDLIETLEKQCSSGDFIIAYAETSHQTTELDATTIGSTTTVVSTTVEEIEMTTNEISSSEKTKEVTSTSGDMELASDESGSESSRYLG